MTMMTARRCRHRRTTCDDPRCSPTMTERRDEIAAFDKADEDGDIAVVVGHNLAGKLHRRGQEYLFVHQPTHPEAASWKPATDKLEKLHGLEMGRTITTAKDHLLAFRAGQLRWEWAVPVSLHPHRNWYAKGQQQKKSTP